MDFQSVQSSVDSLPENEREKISDGYHDFEELYEHRCRLFIALCNALRVGRVDRAIGYRIWKSELHDDGSHYPGWFIAGITDEHGHSMSYHIPDKYFHRLDCKALNNAPKWDGHTSKDVLEFIEREFFAPP